MSFLSGMEGAVELEAGVYLPPRVSVAPFPLPAVRVGKMVVTVEEKRLMSNGKLLALPLHSPVWIRIKRAVECAAEEWDPTTRVHWYKACYRAGVM